MARRRRGIALVEHIAARDKLAMQVLFARHRTNVYRWLLRFVGNETVAEDLLSDVFFDVWQQAGPLLERPERIEGAAPAPAACGRAPSGPG
jgi:DNA-directed RNA polymerase specialized sigma24 family protein